MNYDELLTMSVYDALLRLCAARVPVQIETLTPPAGASTSTWRVARIVIAADDTVVVSVVAEIEGQSGCTKRLGHD